MAGKVNIRKPYRNATNNFPEPKTRNFDETQGFSKKFTENLNSSIFDFSFCGKRTTEFRESEKDDLCLVETLSSENINSSKANSAIELDALLLQAKDLKNRLRKKLQILKEREKEQTDLHCKLTRKKNRRLTEPGKYKTEIYCSCNSSCMIY